MERGELVKGIKSLKEFIKLIVDDKISDKKSYSQWAKECNGKMEQLFWYKQERGMPAIHSLVGVFFHPTLPLLGLNYTPVAHNTLFKFQEGWTVPLRLCRGIVFDRDGNLAAKAFPKFFNYGENKETANLPDLPFEATEKKDGHLGIIFEYKGELLVTTRGSFVSRTSKLAANMLNVYEKQFNWKKAYPKEITILVEIIHPLTKVITDYVDKEEFVAIGAFNRETFIDYGYNKLRCLAEKLGLKTSEIWSGKSLAELRVLIKDHSVKNKEGYVARFSNGLRVKFKFESYIAEMIKRKLDYKYLMSRFISGNLPKTMELLDEELLRTAKEMLGEILIAVSKPGAAQDKWRALYMIVPEKESTSHFQGICRQFVKHITSIKEK